MATHVIPVNHLRCVLLIFGVNGVFLETRFLNNDRVFLFTRPKFRIPLYFYMVIDFYVSHWARNGPGEKSKSKSHRNLIWTSITHWQASLGKEELAPCHCDAKCRAWEGGSTAVCWPGLECYINVPIRCGQCHPCTPLPGPRLQRTCLSVPFASQNTARLRLSSSKLKWQVRSRGTSQVEAVARLWRIQALRGNLDSNPRDAT